MIYIPSFIKIDSGIKKWGINIRTACKEGKTARCNISENANRVTLRRAGLKPYRQLVV
jgi:hypothetical protein